MSENLFRIQSLGQNLVTWWFFALVVFLATFVVYFLVSEALDNKKRKAEEDVRKIKSDSENKIHKLNLESYTAEKDRKDEIVKEIEKIQEDEKVVTQDLEGIVAKYDAKIKKADNLKFVQYITGGIFIFIMFLVLILGPFTGGSFSNIKKADYEEMNLKINAYYVVSYKNVDQITLTVFVKNNSDKSLRSAVIKLKGTNSTSVIRNLDSGEEKIVTLDTYASGDYDFAFENIEFVE